MSRLGLPAWNNCDDLNIGLVVGFTLHAWPVAALAGDATRPRIGPLGKTQEDFQRAHTLRQVIASHVLIHNGFTGLIICVCVVKVNKAVARGNSQVCAQFRCK